MAQMSWLSHLVDTENEKELVEFLKAGHDLKKDKESE